MGRARWQQPGQRASEEAAVGLARGPAAHGAVCARWSARLQPRALMAAGGVIFGGGLVGQETTVQ